MHITSKPMNVSRSCFFALLFMCLCLPGDGAASWWGSEDLGTLASVQMGDVWVRSLPDGKAVRLTEDGRNVAPKLSPSARWVAFRKSEKPYRFRTQVWIASTDGNQSRALDAPGGVGLFAWAPNSDRLAYAAGGELWVVRPGQDLPMLLETSPRSESRVTGISWSADGEWIDFLYEERRDVPEGEWPWRVSIRKAPASGGGVIEILEFPVPDAEGRPGNVQLAGWFNSQLLFWQCEILSASIMADGCPLYALLPDGRQQILPSTLLYPDFLAVSPDKKRLAVSVGDGRETWSGKSIALVDPETGKAEVLTAPETSSLSPAWSPDAERIAYVSGAEPEAGVDAGIGEKLAEAGKSGRHIWVMKRDGSGKRQLTDGNYRDEHPIWSVDGRHVLFARIDPAHRISVWLIGAEGGTPRQVEGGVSFSKNVEEIPGDLDYYGHFEWEKCFDWSPRVVGDPLAAQWLIYGTLGLLILTALFFIVRYRVRE
jgi:Tol biopolymer transport system component